MNRRHFLAAIGAAALAQRPVAVGARPMMADLIGDFRCLCLSGTDRRNYQRNFRKLCRLMIQTGPFVMEGVVLSARRKGDEYVLVQSDELLTAEQSALYGHHRIGIYELPDERLSELCGLPLASRTPVPVWAFRTS